MKLVQKVTISLQLLKVYERLEWGKCKETPKIATLFTTKVLLMPIVNPCCQLLQKILWLSLQLRKGTRTYASELPNWTKETKVANCRLYLVSQCSDLLSLKLSVL